MSDTEFEQQQADDLAAVALADNGAAESFAFAGKTYEVRPPSIRQQRALRLQSMEPKDPRKPNGEKVLNDERLTVLLLIASIYVPGTDKPVFQKAHFDTLYGKPGNKRSFIGAAKRALEKAMGVGDAESLEEQEEGNSGGAPGSDS